MDSGATPHQAAVEIVEIIIVGLRLSRPLSDPQGFERITGEVLAAVGFYGRNGWLGHPEGFFTAPPPLTAVNIAYVKGRRRSYERISFDSGYAPHHGEPGAERWLGYAANKREYALMLRHTEPRPWLVCVHGTEMGRGALDLRLFRAWHLHEQLGLNVILPVLPMHGPRGRGLPRGAVFPGEDALDNVHATDLVEILGRHSGLARDDPRRRAIALAEPIGRMLSPLSLTPRVPLRGRFIYAGIADWLVHPRAHTLRGWEHWGNPQIVWYPGGHAGFFRSRPVHRFVDDALVQSGMVDRASAGSTRDLSGDSSKEVS